MSSYRYCTCGTAMDKPTAEEAVEREHLCPSCGEDNSRPEDFNEFLIDLSDRLSELERAAKGGDHP